MSYDHILLQRSGSITTITLNRPERRNALALPMIAELRQAFERIAQSDARGVILAANGPVFCSGHDFADMRGASLEAATHLFESCMHMMNTMQALPQPIVAKVHAMATAGGCQLVASCDLAVASERASFAIPGGKAGQFCHTPLVAVARNLSRKRALEMAMTGDPIDAATAERWGFINRCVPHEQLDAATLDLITRASRGSQLSMAAGKAAYYRQIDLPQQQAYEFASAVMSEATLTRDAQEGIAAFFEKRHAAYAQGAAELKSEFKAF
jgi:enoyl-CoA hydratase/carnithine racemase